MYSMISSLSLSRSGHPNLNFKFFFFAFHENVMQTNAMLFRTEYVNRNDFASIIKRTRVNIV